MRLSLFALLLVCLPAYPQESTAVRGKMQKFIDDGELSGVVTVFGNKAGVVSTDVLGKASLETGAPMAKDTYFRIASMTKPITAIAVMQLVDAGKLEPGDAVEKYLPEFRGQMLVSERTKDTLTLKKPSRPITVRDLLTHTSGLPGGYPGGIADVYMKRQYNLAETTIAISREPLNFEPGTRWSYCNAGIDTLGRIVEVLSGMSFEDYLAKNVFGPLGMKNTFFYATPEQQKNLAVIYNRKEGKLFAPPLDLIGQPSKSRHPIPAGGLISTGGDIALLCRAMLGGGELDGKRILSEDGFKTMTRVQTGDIKTGFTDGMAYGYGFAVVNKPTGVTEMLSSGTFGHGGAFGTQYWIDPVKDRFFILMIQRTGLPNSDASKMRMDFQNAAVSPAPVKN